jgi:hypothetical protein
MFSSLVLDTMMMRFVALRFGAGSDELADELADLFTEMRHVENPPRQLT